jgi:hypothetical protein
MAAAVAKVGKRRQVISGLVLTPIFAFLAFNVECAGSDPMKGMIIAGAIGMSQPRLVSLKPGMRIDKKPPEGWSHLVMKSIPRLASGDRASLPSGSSKTATLFRSVMLANVKPVDINEKDFELTQVGVGICIPDPQDEDQDIVVSADSLDALGLRHLTTVQRMVLDAAELEMGEGRIIARTPTFALFRSPVTMVDPGSAGKHIKANIHYAFCVNRTTGKLDVAVWTLKPETAPRQPPSIMVKLPTSAVFTCDLDVRARRILGTIPYSWSFAMQALPPGRKLGVSAALGTLMVETSAHPADNDPGDLERLLRVAIPPLPEADIAGDRTSSPRTDKAVRRTATPPPYGGQR